MTVEEAEAKPVRAELCHACHQGSDALASRAGGSGADHHPRHVDPLSNGNEASARVSGGHPAAAKTTTVFQIIALPKPDAQGEDDRCLLPDAEVQDVRCRCPMPRGRMTAA